MARPTRICTPIGLCQLQWMPHKHHNMSHGSSNVTHSYNPVSTTYSSSSFSMSWPSYYPTTTHSGIGGVSTGNSTMNMMDMSDMTMKMSLTAVDVFFIVSGVAFFVLGALGFIFRKNIKRCMIRCSHMCGCCLGRRRSRNSSSSNRNRNNNSGTANSSETYVDIELKDLAPATAAAAAVGACSCSSPRIGGARAMFRRILFPRSGNHDQPMTCSVCGGRVATPGAAGPHGNDAFAGVRLDARGRYTFASASVSTSLAPPTPLLRAGAREGPANITGPTPPLPRSRGAFSNSTTVAGSSSGAAAYAADEPHPGSPLPRWPFLHQERDSLELLGVGGHPAEVVFVLGDDDSDDDDVVAFGESAAGVLQSPSQPATEPGSAF